MHITHELCDGWCDECGDRQVIEVDDWADLNDEGPPCHGCCGQPRVRIARLWGHEWTAVARLVALERTVDERTEENGKLTTARTKLRALCRKLRQEVDDHRRGALRFARDVSKCALTAVKELSEYEYEYKCEEE